MPKQCAISVGWQLCPLQLSLQPSLNDLTTQAANTTLSLTGCFVASFDCSFHLRKVFDVCGICLDLCGGYSSKTIAPVLFRIPDSWGQIPSPAQYLPTDKFLLLDSWPREAVNVATIPYIQ